MFNRLVVSRYNENLEWLSDIPDSIDEIIVYNKGQSKPLVSNDRAIVKNIPNVGREAQTWCHHIIENWGDIADNTYFLQGDPSHHTDNIDKRISRIYENPTPLTFRYTEEWPGVEVTRYDLVKKFEDIEVRLGNMKFFGHRPPRETKRWFYSIWNTVFDCAPPSRYYYGYGAMWAVPKENIKHRSLDFWNNLNDKLQHNEEAYTQEIDAWALEALWLAIWEGPKVYPSKI